MRTVSIFVAHVAEAIGSPRGGGRDGVADFPGFTAPARAGRRCLLRGEVARPGCASSGCWVQVMLLPA
jgi:hypothetical protein